MFYGSIPALVTPFSGNCVDEDSLGNFIDWQISEGSTGLVPCGTTGEAPPPSPDEELRVAEHVVEEAARRGAGRPRRRGGGAWSTRERRFLTRAEVVRVLDEVNRPVTNGLHGKARLHRPAVQLHLSA